jgi:hypothetical protein
MHINYTGSLVHLLHEGKYEIKQYSVSFDKIIIQ